MIVEGSSRLELDLLSFAPLAANVLKFLCFILSCVFPQVASFFQEIRGIDELNLNSKTYLHLYFWLLLTEVKYFELNLGEVNLYCQFTTL